MKAAMKWVVFVCLAAFLTYHSHRFYHPVSVYMVGGEWVFIYPDNFSHKHTKTD